MVHVSLSQFEGPLDLLLHLISQAKIDIKDIFVSDITDQYLEYMRQADALDMDTASEFLAMAATLLEIKSRALLPRPPAPTEPDEESPEEALLRRLTEYKAFKEAALELKVLENGARGLFSRLPQEAVEPNAQPDLNGVSVQSLWEAFARILARARTQDAPAVDAPRRIRREAYSVQECMLRIGAALLSRPSMPFEELFDTANGPPLREEVVSVFFALLEMIRLERVTVAQEGAYAPILLKRRKKHGN